VRVGNAGRAAVVTLRVPGKGRGDLGWQVTGVCDLAACPRRLRFFPAESPPRRVVVAPGHPLGFFTNIRGELYAFDPASDLQTPTFLGSQPDPRPPVLECNGDGSQVVVAGHGMTSWDRAGGRWLWRRDDLLVASARFLPCGKRLVCGQSTGQVLILDAATGDTLQTLHRHLVAVSRLAVSPDGRWLASLDGYGNCFLTEPSSGRRAWSARYELTVLFQFSSCGRQFVVANSRGGLDLAVVATATGEVLRVFNEWDDGIAGLSLAPSGAVVVWSNCHQALVARDLATRAAIYELPAARSPDLPQPSSVLLLPTRQPF
jgi:WD40 repeat protein